MALIFPHNSNYLNRPFSPVNPNSQFKIVNFSLKLNDSNSFRSSSNPYSSRNLKWMRRQNFRVFNELEKDSGGSSSQDDELDNTGVKAALAMLKFYKREISPLLPKSCRYVPTCSEYSMIAYKKYGVVKGTILTAWRICRCNPLGGSGFDPPRWFGETAPPEE